MRRRERLAGLLLLVALLAAVNLGRQVYGWFAYADERGALQGLSDRLEVAGLEVMRTQLGADSLRRRIQQMDRELGSRKQSVAAFERFVQDGALPAHLYDAYRAELDGYNRQVQGRNEVFARWKEVVVRNHAAVGRFNGLADSIRSLADRIGEPYFQIPSPVEIAAERGLVPVRGGSGGPESR